MNEPIIGRKIKHALDERLSLPAETRARLAAARAHALERQQVRESLPALAFAGRVGMRLSDPTQWFRHVILPVALLVAAIIGMEQWQERQRGAQATAEIVEVDSGLLKSDLPIDAYLDRDFLAWLKRSSD
ncbi:MAG: DUF3619 family protein [Burkholderiales bacterium]|nr:DUF3619 family protein [Burkholderiales bacterium]